MRVSDATLSGFSYYRERGRYFKEHRATKERCEVSQKGFAESLAIARALIDEHRGDYDAARIEAERIVGGLAQ